MACTGPVYIRHVEEVDAEQGEREDGKREEGERERGRNDKWIEGEGQGGYMGGVYTC